MRTIWAGPSDRKIFNVKHYDTAQLAEVLKPLMPAYGHITSDPTTVMPQ